MAPILQFLWLSVLGGIITQVWLMIVCTHGRPRLLKRQLYHQALASLLFDLMSLPVGILHAVGDSPSSDDFYGDLHDLLLTRILRACQHGLFFTICLVEVHIAASMAAASYRAPWALNRLKGSINYVWALSMVYFIESLLVSRLREEVMYVYAYDPIGSLLIILCFAATIALYVWADFMSRQTNSPDAVIQRIRRRATVYPLIFVVTGWPVCLRYFGIIDMYTTRGVLSIALEHAAGILNAFAFCFFSGMPAMGTGPVSHATTAVELELAEKEVRAAHVVAFSATVEQKDIPATGSWRMAMQWRDRGASLDSETPASRCGSEGGEQSSDALWGEYVGQESYTLSMSQAR